MCCERRHQNNDTDNNTYSFPALTHSQHGAHAPTLQQEPSFTTRKGTPICTTQGEGK